MTPPENTSQKTQCYMCRAYGRQVLFAYDHKGYSNSIKQHYLKLYVNSMGFRGIERAIGVNHHTVINPGIAGRFFFTRGLKIISNS